MSLNEPATFDLITQKNVDLWLEGQYDEKTKEQIRYFLKNDPKQVVDAFYTSLNFGTGGLRGLMGVGSNRMNNYTIRATTQGLAYYILKQTHSLLESPSVFIGYDSRHHSREFAEEAAKVLAANLIQVYLFKDIRPTPLVSFACRYKKCTAAIMITASHNPAEYNGYKVYWSDGGQVVPPHDQGIIEEALKITDPTMVKIAPNLLNSLIQIIDTEVDDAYITAIRTLQNYAEINKKQGNQIKTVYTSLHGVGITMIPKVFTDWGFSIPKYVEPQIIPDGSFPTVNSPNPEDPAALQMGIDILLKSKSDVLIATDPDGDRMGIAVYHQGQAALLNGNQIASLCLEHICEALSQQKKLPERAAFIKSIGTTELFKAICEKFQCPCYNVLTGFKYIAEKIHTWEVLPDGFHYIFGGEESYGTLLGSFSRDKDAILASALICEITLQAKLQGKTLIDKLHDLYYKYGIYEEGLLSVNFEETKEGKEQMAKGMKYLRETPFSQIQGVTVIAVEDYLLSTKFYLASGKTEHLALPISDVLLYWLEDGTKLMIRPSGTEPKVKIYVGVVEKTFPSIVEGLQSSRARCETYLQAMKQHLFA
jgi:phosphomannomutase